MTAAAGWRRRGRLPPAVAASLLVHALLLSLSFGDGVGLPGLELPWQKRRAEVPELRVTLQPLASPAAVPPPATLPGPPAAAVDTAPAPADAAPPPAPPPPEEAAAQVRLMSPAELPLPAAAPPARELLAVERPPLPVWAVQAASAVPSAVIAAMSAASAPTLLPLTRSREALAARSDHASELAQLSAPPPDAAVAALQGASAPAVEMLRGAGSDLRAFGDREAREARERRAELAQLDAARAPDRTVVAAFAAASSPAVEMLRRAGDALRVPAAGQARDRAAELAQLSNAGVEARQRAQQLEAARADAMRQEAARAEAAAQEAARQEAARVQAARAEAARLEGERQEAARQEAARAAAATLAAARADDEQREARKRAIGRQLDEEAARRDAERQRPDWAPARRGRLFGRTDSNAELVRYGEAWAAKIQFNQTFELVREAAAQPYTDPVVTVAVRSNGSVESVTFVRSSGVPAIDEAVRRIVQSQENYPAFPPALQRDYDVVEIRRNWHFDTAVRLY